MTAAAPSMAAVDEVASGACAEELVALLTGGAVLAGSPVRCPVTDADDEARCRLDLALRMLRSQSRAHWCRPVGDGTAVVVRWPLPARGIALHAVGADPCLVLLLALGRAGATPDVWRFRFDAATTATTDRAWALVQDLWLLETSR